VNLTIVIYPGVDELDALGPYAVLAHGRRVDPGFRAALASEDGEPVTAAGGAVLTPHRSLAPALEGDLLLIPGGGWNARSAEGARRQASNPALLACIRDSQRSGATIAGVCTGVMILAHAGVLQGRTVVTHAGAIPDLRAFDATIVEDARVVDDGAVITCGGVTSGIDLALHVLERWLGPEAAERVGDGIEYQRRGRVLVTGIDQRPR
jgi:transcriptional regulator GlxA family with amidase domain